ncbi:MAG: ZIP family metal transporter [Acidobacteriota bacterium]
MLLLWILGFSLLGSVGSLALAATALVLPRGVRRSMVPSLVSYATGAFLGAAFLGLLPHAIDLSSSQQAMATVMVGILLFFVLEKLVLWHHCHDDSCEVHGVAGPMVLFGDALHNFIDGIVIVAAFLVSIPLGVAASLAVIAHEIPQEVSNFAILLDSGFSRRRALAFNLLSSFSTLVGALLAYFFLRSLQALTPYIMALSAASFIYIAIADLIPGLHREHSVAQGLRQLALMLLGVGSIATSHLLTTPP